MNEPMGLREEIQFAFSKVPHPGDDQLTSCHCQECQWEIERFRHKKWSGLKWEDVGGEGGNISALTPAAFHYFLPGLLLLILDHRPDSDNLMPAIMSRFSVPDTAREDQLKNVQKNIKRLTSRQRKVIADCIRQLASDDAGLTYIWEPAIQNLLSGNVQPYSQEAMLQWVKKHY